MNNWKDTLLFRALRQQPVPRPPIWLMRQAGRYLPEYRAIRKEAGGFLAMAKNPQIASEITLQPIRRFGFDAAILFSDILTIPDAMGLGLFFSEGEGPRFSQPLQTEEAIQKLRPASLEELRYVMDASVLTRQTLPAETPLIGFCGSPFTLACYMIDGSGGNFWRTRQMRFSRPDLLRRVLEINTISTAELLCAQIDAGCQAVMIFDSWGGLLGGEPANFLDVGGGADKEKVAEAFKLMLVNPGIRAILINIFGGIMRCDIIAEGVVAAAREMEIAVPLVVRLEGTNVEQGKKILAESGLAITTASDMADAAQKAVAAAA
jgi:hypothetical protein